jgi:hypothetical protein
MRLSTWLAMVAAFVVQSSTVFAEGPVQKPPSAEKALPDRVHLGSSSVTVVDEHEKVDDVITRLRSAKAKPAAANNAKSGENAAQGTTAPSGSGQPQDGRAALQPQRESAAAHDDAERPKDERRERAANARGRIEKKQRR